ncbi:hypothetical protein E4O01_13945 [Treponema sp. OMZ 790]|nr:MULTISPECIES: hypothetical protein [unclassified Treponema]UTC69725.1 hypothetical protein E4O01_13945 [Treponema sp. OMZ 790]UTC72439.1 hypothetical protein E4O02_14035 [Treponema sp. OMZ 791]
MFQMENLWSELNEMIPFYYKDIIEQFSLVTVKLNDIETILIKRNSYGLKVSIDRFNAYLSYIMRNDDKKLVQLNCDSFIVEKFDKKDREGIVLGETVRESIINDLLILKKGLLNKFSCLLNGDKQWIDSYKKSEWFYREERVSADTEEKIKLFL